MSDPTVQLLDGPHGMTSRINWTLLGQVMIQRASFPLARPAPQPEPRTERVT